MSSGCLDDEMDPALQGGTGSTFIALQRDFQSFLSWSRTQVGDAEIVGGHAAGPRFAYVSTPPVNGKFPVGAMIAKTVEVGDPSTWSIHAKAKRGGGFNPSGTINWEWFELRIVATNDVTILGEVRSRPRTTATNRCRAWVRPPPWTATATPATRRRQAPTTCCRRCCRCNSGLEALVNQRGFRSFVFTALVCATLASTAAPARAQPTIEMPGAAPPPPALPNGAAAAASIAAEPASAGSTVIGGYGQMDLKFLRTGFGNDFVGRANLRRIVMLVAHQWTDEILSLLRRARVGERGRVRRVPGRRRSRASLRQRLSCRSRSPSYAPA